jgi:hypothetical protein
MHEIRTGTKLAAYDLYRGPVVAAEAAGGQVRGAATLFHNRDGRVFMFQKLFSTAVAAMLTLGLLSPSNAGVTTTYLATDLFASPSVPPSTTNNSYNEAIAFIAAAQALGPVSTHDFLNQIVTNCSGLFGDGNVAWSYTGSYLASESCVTNTQTGNANDGFNAFGNVKWLGINTGSMTLTFLSGPTNSFGAFFTGLGVGLTASFNDGASKSLSIPAISGAGEEFWGFTDTSGFSQITITYASTCGVAPACDNFGVDGIVFNNNVVPEPGTLSLLGLSIAALAALRRRKH